MDENKLLHALYTVFLGVLIALFVGVGISTFYTGPEEVTYPTESAEIAPSGQTQKERDIQARYDRDYEAYNNEYEDYSRNVSIVALITAVLLIVIGIVFEVRLASLASGILLGGIFTLLYSIGRGFAAEDSRYVFMVLTASLVIVFYLGYRRFIVVAPSKNKSKKSRRK